MLRDEITGDETVSELGKPTFTLSDYLESDRRPSEKHEFAFGEIAMTGRIPRARWDRR